MSLSGDAGGSVLVVDVGTSGVRAAIVRPDASVEHVHHAPVLPDTPAPGLVEFDAGVMAGAVLAVARSALADGGPVDGVGIANQRASTIVWERATGTPLAPGIGWQDLRTVGTCLALQAEGIRIAPNASATKVMAILDDIDPDRARGERGELCFGTVDTWVAWVLSGGAAAAPRHSTSPTPRTPPSPRLVRPGHGGLGRAPAPAAAHPPRPAATHRRLVGPGRSRPRPGGHAPDLRHRRRPTGLPRRAGVHAARPGQGHLRHRRHARPVHRDRRGTALRPLGAGPGPSRSWPSGWPGRRPGAPRRSCSRPGRASSGCATTSASSPPPTSRPPSPPSARARATSGSCRRCSDWARPCGTSGPGAPWSA